MTKANITQYSSTPSSNADINDINIAENCPASGLNNAIRELMAHLKNVDTGSQALTALSVAGSVTATTSLKTPLIEFTDGDNALTIADGGNVTANANLTVSGDLIASSLNGGQFGGRRNLIINGAMQVDQRNSGSSVTPADTDYTVDRWRYTASQASKFTFQQNTGSTPPTGFKNYMGFTVASAVTVGNADYFAITQRIEGNNVSQLELGTANAETITLSFLVRSSLTGTFGGALRGASFGRSYPFTYSISSANTWESKTITIAGDTSGTYQTDTTTGLEVIFGLGVGSDNSGSAGAWTGSGHFSATGAVSVVGTSSATWYCTGVQLEVGSQATPFEHRSFGEELALCQRYFEIVHRATGFTFSSSSTAILTSFFQTEKRATPAVTAKDDAISISNGIHTKTQSSFGFTSTPSTSAMALAYNNFSSLTTNYGYAIFGGTNEIYLDAEL